MTMLDSCRKSMIELIRGMSREQAKDADVVQFLDAATRDELFDSRHLRKAVELQTSAPMERAKATGYTDLYWIDGALVAVVPDTDPRLGTAAITRFDRGGHPANPETIL